MPYTHVTRTAYGADALQYIRGDGEGHNGSDVRNNYIVGVNMLPDDVIPFEQQMKPFWNKARANHTTQIDRYILSFSKKELDPENPADIAKASNIGCELVRRLAPGHQAMVATQTDGAGGLIHVHMAVNDVNMTTCKGLPASQYLHANVRRIADEVCHQYFDLAAPDLAPEKESQFVRTKKEKNERIMAANAREQKQAQAEGRDPKLQATEYIWIDDLKSRIREAAKEAKNETEFFAGCRQRGVEVERRHATKKQPEHYCYELTDVSKFQSKRIPTNLKAKSYKLGGNYQPEGIADMSKAFNLQEFQQAAPDRSAVSVPPSIKPAVKEPPKQEAISNRESMQRAKDEAKRITRAMYSEAHGWELGVPRKADGHFDFAEADRRTAAFNDAWDDFTEWRVQKRKRGTKLAPIYRKDEDENVTVIDDALKQQFSDYLDNPEIIYEDVIVVPQDDDEPPMPSRRPQESRDTRKTQDTAKAPETPQEPPKAAQDDAEQQRSVLDRWRRDLMAEVNRRAKETDEREEEKQRQTNRENGWDE